MKPDSDNVCNSLLQDPTELILLSLTILFCPDMLDLTERKKVEQFQLKFAILLQKYITFRLDVKHSTQSFNIFIL